MEARCLNCESLRQEKAQLEIQHNHFAVVMEQRALTAEQTVRTLTGKLDALEQCERERLAESLKLPMNQRMHDIKSAKLEAYAEIRAALSAIDQASKPEGP